MQYFYSPSMVSCYVDVVHGSNIPDDVIIITEKEHNIIHRTLSEGKTCVLKRDEKVITVTCATPKLLQNKKMKQRIQESQEKKSFSTLSFLKKCQWLKKRKS